MARIDRRRLLKFSGASAVAAGTGGIAAILASGRAPAYGQATSIHWLRWADFVPISDKVLKDQIAPQCQKALGIKLNIEDDQRQRPPGSHDGSDPIRSRPGRYHAAGYLAATLYGQPRRCLRCGGGHRQDTRRLL